MVLSLNPAHAKITIKEIKGKRAVASSGIREHINECENSGGGACVYDILRELADRNDRKGHGCKCLEAPKGYNRVQLYLEDESDPAKYLWQSGELNSQDDRIRYLKQCKEKMNGEFSELCN